MSLTPAVAEALRLAQLGLCRADGRPPSRLLPPDIKQEITDILIGWGLR